MNNSTPIGQIMSRRLVTATCDNKVSEVRRLMIDNDIHHVPVVEGRKLAGLISYTDIAELSFTEFNDDERVRDAVLDERCTVAGLMRTELVTLRESTTLREAARTLSTVSMHSAPVLTEDGSIVGVVTSTDLMRVLAD